MKKRAGEISGTWFRSDRMYTVNGWWFFMTREGASRERFSSRMACEKALAGFIRDLGGHRESNYGYDDFFGA